MPGWAGYYLEFHGNAYSAPFSADIYINVAYPYDGKLVELGGSILGHNQYFYVKSPYTFPDNVHNVDGYVVEWFDEDWQKWVLWHVSYKPALQVIGCPYVSTWNGIEYVPENTVLVESEILKPRKHMDLTDYYLINNSHTIRENIYSIQLQEFEQDTSYIDSIELLVADYPQGLELSLDPQGNIVLYIPIHTRLNTRFTTEIASSNVNRLKTDLVIVSPYVKTSYSFKVNKVYENKSVESIHLYPRMFPYRYALFTDKDISKLKMELNDHKLYSIEYGIPVNASYHIVKEKPLLATSDIGGEITEELLEDDGHYAVLTPGDNITLNFKVPPALSSRMKRALILVIKGFYVQKPPTLTKDAVRVIYVPEINGYLFVPLLETYDEILSIMWDFGDGTTSDFFVPFHVYKQGKYKGSLKVKYLNGKTLTIPFYWGG